MMDNKKSFPKHSRLWHGAILHTIAHAISIASNPILSYEVSWEDQVYKLQDSMGSHGVILFAENYVIGAFFDEESSRNPFRLNLSNYDFNRLITEIPAPQLSDLNKKILPFFLDEYQGTLVPVITSVFWSKGEYLTGSEPWETICVHGGHLINTEVMEQGAALLFFKDEYEFSVSQLSLLKSLYNRRITLPISTYLKLNKTEYENFISNGNAGLEESKE